MAKRKKNKKRKRKKRKKTIARLEADLANVKERSLQCLAFALGYYKGGEMTKRNKKRAKDAKNHWSKEDWD